MSEAMVFQDAIPDGWYDDPATPDMERWWSGTEWSEHVRYADRARPRSSSGAVAEQAPATAFDTPPDAPFAAVFNAPFAASAVAPLQQLGIVPAPAFDDFYIPMRRSESGPASSARLVRQRTSARVAILWVVVLAVTGAAVGGALWVFLPQ